MKATPTLRASAAWASGLAAAMAALAPGPAWADGGLIIEEGETEVTDQGEAAARGLVSSSGQRALLWLRDDGCWDLVVDPGHVELGGAAWVLPLPTVPEVSEPSPGLLDQLDGATTPVLVTHTRTVVTHYRTSSSGGGGLGCGGAAVYDGAGEGEVTGTDVEEGGDEAEPPPVQVWGGGRLSDLAYDVVSAEDPEALFTWLEENGYAVPAAMEEPVARYVEEGFVFFAARLVRTEGDPSTLPVVRFGLCGGARPFYPLRLSTLSVADGLGFTLWIVVPSGHSPYAPANASHGAVSADLGPLTYDPGDMWYDEPTEWPPPDFPTYYEETVSGIMGRDGGRSLALELSAVLDEAALQRRVEVLGAEASELGLDRSASWEPELRDIVEEGRRVLRYRGMMPVAVMGEDLVFQVDLVPDEPGVHVREVTYREEVWDSGDEEEEVEAEPAFGSLECAAPGRARRDRGLPLLLLAALGLGLATRRFLGRSG